MKTQHAEPPTLVTIESAARDLSLSRRTLYRMIDAGAIPVVKLTPRSVRIPREDLAKYVQARTVNAKK